jgi:ABC-type polysaccharide/polyol phosphate export permease
MKFKPLNVEENVTVNLKKSARFYNFKRISVTITKFMDFVSIVRNSKLLANVTFRKQDVSFLMLREEVTYFMGLQFIILYFSILLHCIVKKFLGLRVSVASCKKGQ